MPRAKSCCAQPGCPEVATAAGRCEEHKRQPWAGSDRRATLPADWSKRRAAVLKRDGYACQLRLPGCSVRATDVDHAGHRDNHDLAALRSACAPCHRQRTTQQAAEARRRQPC